MEAREAREGTEHIDDLERTEQRHQRRRNSLACAGCVLSVLGATAAGLVWAGSDRTRIHMGGGFEGEGTDFTVLVTELPLVFLAGALLPALTCLLLARLTTRRTD